MLNQKYRSMYTKARIRLLFGLTAVALLLGYSGLAKAIPVFARQTGQNCVACHAGGQFPELTPYGRLFKLTAYTMGSRTVPVSMMAVLDATKVRNNKDSSGAKAFDKQSSLLFDFGSVFLAGKITDNLGLFGQFTYANYDHKDDNGNWKGHYGPDNTELRYADRFISPGSDLIVGAFANNNPSMQDVWNSTPAWGYPYLGPSFNLGAPASPMLDGTLGQESVGAGVYAFWNKSLYGELSMYKTANGPFGFLHSGDNSQMLRIKDGAPYWRLAYNKDFGPHNLMVGTSGMIAELYENSDTTQPTDRFQDIGVDAQYEYILDPHTVTAHASYIHEKAKWGTAFDNASDTLNEFKLKGAYVYNAKYGVSLAYNQITGSTDAGLYGGAGDVTGNLSGNPGTTSWTPEIFWTPIQYLRLGAQYWHYTKFNGASSNYDGFGRSASANDTLFFYVWGAY
ncbi:MAG: cytochrome C [Thiobacillaceae bacterium]